jgi:hypothetical protein
VPHRLNAFLASNLELRQLSSKVKQLSVLQRHYESFVPPSLQGSSRVLQFRQQVVIIATDNGAVAAKLRQMTSDFISLFQARGCEVTGIQIRVQVTARPPVAKAKPHVLSKAAQRALRELGENLPDSPLKTALRQLARRAGD